MAQRTALKVTCRKIVLPNGTISFNGGDTTAGTTKDVVVLLGNQTGFCYSIPARTGSTSTDDTCIVLSDGSQYWVIQESVDFFAALSATDTSGS